MGAIILDDAEIGDECLIGAGALITQGKKIPPRSVVMGAPGKVVRSVTPEELQYFQTSAENYRRDSLDYRSFLRGPEKWGESDSDLEDLEDGELE